MCDYNVVLVVVDTCIFAEDYHLRTTLLRLLIEHCSTAGHQLVIPEVVVRELVNRYREGVEERRSKLLNAAKAVKDLTGREFPVDYSADHLQADIRVYDHELRNAIADHGGRIHPMPNTSHDALISRDLARRKPFSQTGKGYRDALIWENILELAGAGHDIAFITANKDDFAEKDLSLHHDLQKDLEDRGIGATRVVLYATLKSFLDQHVIIALPKPHQELARFTLATVPRFSLEAAVEHVALDNLPHREVSAWMLGRPRELEDPTISMIGSPRNITVLDQRELESRERLIEFSADIVDCLFDCYVEKSEFFYLRNEEGLSLDEEDWNERYVTAQFYDTVRVSGYLTLAAEDGRITSSEIVEVTGASKARRSDAAGAEEPEM
jgi:rRNA-processing protein FCF1